MQKTRRDMLDDIEAEVACTRRLIGREQLDPRVMAAMAQVPRERFVPEEARAMAFDNGPLPIGHGQTISQPYIVALMTDMLALQPQHRVLEVGTGSGYQTAVLAQLCARVYTVEVVEALGAAAAARLRDLGCDNVDSRIGNGCAGWAEHAPYDAIMVTAAAARIPPALIEQLAAGGRMAIPVGRPFGRQTLMLVTKDADGTTHAREVLGVAFVPLVEN